jgi:hypothetical protein
MLGFPSNPMACFRSAFELADARQDERFRLLEHALTDHVDRFGHTELSLVALRQQDQGDSQRSPPLSDCDQ